MKLAFTVLGKPEAGGSKRAFIVKGKAIVTDANKNAGSWKQQVRTAARTAVEKSGRPLLCTGPVRLTAHFFFTRPRSHLRGNNGDLRKGAPVEHTQKPDVLKCMRLLEDALTGMIYIDDAQIIDEHMTKHWTTDAPGIRVEVEEL